jgi:hypothetical protein
MYKKSLNLLKLLTLFSIMAKWRLEWVFTKVFKRLKLLRK